MHCQRLSLFFIAVRFNPPSTIEIPLDESRSERERERGKEGDTIWPLLYIKTVHVITTAIATLTLKPTRQEESMGLSPKNIAYLLRRRGEYGSRVFALENVL
jgi:hypothetical protein